MALVSIVPAYLFFSVLTLAVAILGRLAYARFFGKERGTRLRLPPGPPLRPLVGNIKDVPEKYQDKALGRLAETYGDVMYLRVLGRDVVVLSSLRAARDLLQKRSAIYSDRPRFVFLTEIMGWDPFMSQMPYGERHRRHRRFVHGYIGKDVIGSYRALMEYEAASFVQALLTKNEIRFPIRKFAAATMFQIAYGHRVLSMDDYFVQLAERTTSRAAEATTPGSMLVDFFPLLKYIPAWMPYMGFKRNALDIRKDVIKFLTEPYEMVKKQMVSGEALPSLTLSLLEEHARAGLLNEETEEDIKGASGILYAAATDTTSGVLETFVLAMVRHPEVYAKLQAEMDTVVPRDRMPEVRDRAALPYLECVYKEVYRWNAPVPLGMPHRVVKDDMYRDYYIPGGATIIANIWAMSQDSAVYEEPKKFIPERYLDHSVPDFREFVFGFGRRECPGRHFADASIWMAVASVIAMVDLSAVVDEKGQPIMPALEFMSGFVSHPKPFPCAMRPRDENTLALVAQTCASREPDTLVPGKQLTGLL